MKSLRTCLLLALPLVAFSEVIQKLTPQTAQAIFENLNQFAAGAEIYYLENHKSTASLDDLLGPDKHMKRLVVVAGEDYRTIVFKKGTPVALTAPSGETIGVDARGNETCTYIFHKVGPKDSAASIAATANLTVEQLKALNPDRDLEHLQPSQVVRLK